VLEARRLQASLAASALLHALAVAWLFRPFQATTIPEPPVARLIAVSLVGSVGGGEAGSAPKAAPPAIAPATVTPPPLVEKAKRPRRSPTPAETAALPTRSAPPEIAPSGAATDASGAATTGGRGGSVGGSGGSGGSGDGDGAGDGSGGARVAYGSNPRPPYPLVARRLGKEGVVLLDVLVAPDGRPTEVRLAQSSGFAPLDDSAASTVRNRWRFVPARRDGAPIESRVTVPIRFRIEDAPRY
jgi:protein TonB